MLDETLLDYSLSMQILEIMFAEHDLSYDIVLGNVLYRTVFTGFTLAAQRVALR